MRVQRVGIKSSYTLPANVENGIVTGSDAFTLTGNELPNQLVGNSAANLLQGAGGSDILDGGPGDDTASFASSPRAVLINLASQAATDGIDTDTLISIENAIGSNLDDTIVSSNGPNRIDGGGGIDTVSYVAAPRAVLINLAGQVTTDGIVTDTLVSIENATGSPFDDTIVSGDGPNRIDGGPGSDTVSYAAAPRAMLINLPGGAATDGIDTDTLVSIENAVGWRSTIRSSAATDRTGLTGVPATTLCPTSPRRARC